MIGPEALSRFKMQTEQEPPFYGGSLINKKVYSIMKKAIDFKINIASLTVRLAGNQDETLEFCKEYLTDDEHVDIFVSASDEDVDGEIARHAGGGTRKYYEKIYLYRQMAERLPEFDCFAFHGAAIKVGGKGFVFSAPPGTGKSTHIMLLKKYFGDAVTVINGDKPIIRVAEEGATICPCPWAGKEGWQTKEEAPLSGIVLLKRGKVSSIKRISPSEYLEELIKQAYLPENSEAFLKTLELMDRATKNVPFYLLECDISKSAAEASFEVISSI